MKKTALFSLLSTILVAGISATPLSSCATVNTNTKAQVINSTTNGYTKITFCLKDADRSTSKIVGQTVVSVKAGRKFGSIIKPEASKTGCEFNYWSDSQNTTYTDETVIPSTDTILYANFKDPAVEQFTVTLFLNGGTIEEKEYVVKTVDTGTVLSNVLDTSKITAPDGYEFDYWADENGTKITDATIETITKNRCYYANWKSSAVNFLKCDWSEINKYCKEFENTDQGEEAQSAFCAHFLNGTTPITSMNDFVGLERTISVNGTDHTVRVIGTQHDEIAKDDNGTGTGKKAALTFEFKNFICDSNGYSLATVWQNTATTAGSAYNYLNSTMRATLDGRGEKAEEATKDILFVDAADTVTQNVTFKSLVEAGIGTGVMKDVVKRVVTSDKDVSGESERNYWSSYSTKPYTATLFNQTGHEIGLSSSYIKEDGDSTYSYWSNKTDDDRIHKQIAANPAKTSSTKITGGSSSPFKYSSIYNFAGYNSSTTSEGSYFWLSSPCINSSTSYGACRIELGGAEGGYGVYNGAYPIAPCFCI